MKLLYHAKRFFEMMNLWDTLRFNFHYFPLRVAWHLPVYVKAMSGSVFEGRVLIEADRIHRGMVRQGYTHNAYVRRGIYLELRGTLILHDSVMVGNDSKILLYKGAILEIGEGVGISNSQISSACEVTIGRNTIIGNNCRISDCDFHVLIDRISGRPLVPWKRVSIGEANWLGFDVVVSKGAVTPDQCTIASRSEVKGGCKFPPYSIIGGAPAVLIDENYERNPTPGKDWFQCHPKWKQMEENNRQKLEQRWPTHFSQ